jgi:heat shock protein HtpX
MYSHIAANKRNTVILMLAFILVVWGLGWVMSRVMGNPGLVVGMLVFAVVYSIFGYFASAKIALAMSGAKPIAKSDAPELYRIVENLSITAGLPMPKVYIIHDAAPNAFATGRDPKHAVVAVTTGLLEMMDDNELEGVIAHELSHVGNYDIRLMAMVIVLVTIISLLSEFFLRFTLFGGGGDDEDSPGSAYFAIIGFVLALIAPIIATLMQLAVSRKREYLADASGALLTRYPQGLASALAKIGSYNRPMRHASTANAHLFFANPLKGRRLGAGIASLFSTHPPVEERIKRLQQMEVSS